MPCCSLVCVCVCLILGIYGCTHCDNVYSCIYQSIPSMYLCIHLSIYLSLPCVMQLYVQIYSVVYLSIDRSIYTVCVCVSVCAGEQRSLVLNSAQRMYSLQDVFCQYEWRCARLESYVIKVTSNLIASHTCYLTPNTSKSRQISWLLIPLYTSKPKHIYSITSL